jgi:hypothetical protein
MGGKAYGLGAAYFNFYWNDYFGHQNEGMKNGKRDSYLLFEKR